MSTQWTIVASTDRLTLDGANRGEVTFTVANSGSVPDRAVFEVVPEEPASRTWFYVAEPQRLVPPAGSVWYQVKAVVPPATPAGSYWLRGRVHSADTAPEESSKLGARVGFDVKQPERARSRWWPLRLRAVWVSRSQPPAE